MSDIYLAHHGILGQKWGVRRFQNKDGSYISRGKAYKLAGEAKNKSIKSTRNSGMSNLQRKIEARKAARESIDNSKKHNKSIRIANNKYVYSSEKTRKLKSSGNKAAYEKSKELDKKLSEKERSLTLGEKFVRSQLIGPYSNRLTYDIARESGYSRGRAWLKANIDLSAPQLYSTIAWNASKKFTENVGGEKGKRYSAAVADLTRRTVDKSIARNGSELSLRQNSLRNKYIAGKTPNEKKKEK